MSDKQSLEFRLPDFIKGGLEETAELIAEVGLPPAAEQPAGQQMTIGFLPPLARVVFAEGESLESKFARFHAANPQLLDVFIRLTRQVKNRGRRCGMALIYERVRWEYMIKVDRDESNFRLNNNYKAFYARLIMKAAPDLDGFFDIRSGAHVGPGPKEETE